MMKTIFILIACLLTVAGIGQQDPIYSQYITNPLTINPAYAGINNQFAARIQYRTQWAGIDANPTTFNFSGNMSIVQNKVGVGIMALQDKLGDIKNFELAIPVAYKIRVTPYSYLSFGMQAGIINQRNNPDELSILHPDDPAFMPYSESKFNLGAGIMYRNEKLRIGLSAPRMLPTKINTGGQSIELYKQHFYLFTSYIFELEPTFWFRPSILLRSTKGVPVSADLNATFTFRENYSGGVFTRNMKTFGAFIQVLFQNYNLAYTFELPQSGSSSLRFVSHEITLGFSKALLTYHDVSPKAN